tara:strand:+ start:231 stop:1172 length:942 start_codon:yes stop_codon:yes gene_type:complete
MTVATLLHPDVLQYIKRHQKMGSKNLIGVGCTRLPETIPTKTKAECEKNIEGLNNSLITLGRDCPSGIFSGANKQTQSGMIDLVAGRMSSTIHKELEKDPKKNLDRHEMDRNFFADAARVYISQKTLRVDDYLGMEYTVGYKGNADTLNLSSVIMKSDCTRIVGRENVRIYAGGARADNFDSGGEPRSDNSSIVNPKIELIASLDGRGEKNLQPVVMGKSLVSYLENRSVNDKQILVILQKILTQITSNSSVLAGLTMGSYGPMAVKFAIQNVNSMSRMVTKQINDTMDEINSLDKAGLKGKNSILSQTVFTT